jgi:homopolymeric O-antigen transport system ATP-binding protein
MSNETLIRVEKVSKKFCRDLKTSLLYGASDIFREVCGRKGDDSEELRQNEFWALEDISFEVKRGECLGLIGRNGAGKSTLLKIINGIIKPTRGRISVFGNVGAMIELFSGINPILTGRENIYINGSILGVSKKQMKSKIDEIIDFSGIEKFIDTPVQFYSTGMKVRLGFSIATSILSPDVLLLDEVLAVGDAHFRSKCYNRIGKITKNSAVIFVSHAMSHIYQICNHCLLVDDGHMTHYGDVAQGIQLYSEHNTEENNLLDYEAFEIREDPVKSVNLDWSKHEVRYGETIELIATVESLEPISNVSIRIPFYDISGTVVAEWNSKCGGINIHVKKGVNRYRLTVGPLYLRGGTYQTAFVLNDTSGVQFLIWSYKKLSLRVLSPPGGSAAYQLPANQVTHV